MWQSVTKEEFNLFIKNYPTKLIKEEVRICEPPVRFYRDESKNLEWPNDAVARITYHEDMKGMTAYNGKLNSYEIKET